MSITSGISRPRRLTLSIAGAVIATTIAGTAIFLYFGSSYGVIALAVGVPAVIILGVGTLVYSRISVSDSTVSNYARQRSRAVGEDFREFYGRYDRLRDRYPHWDHQALENDIEQFVRDMDEQGIDIDRATGGYRLTDDRGKVEELERLAGAIDELADHQADSFESFAEDELERLQSMHRLLVTEGLADDSLGVTQSDISIDEAGDVEGILDGLTQVEADLERSLESTTGVLRSIQSDLDETADVNVDSVIDEIQQLSNERDYEGAIDLAFEAQNRMKTGLSGDFEAKRTELESVVEIAQESIAIDYIPPPTADGLREQARKIEAIDSALEYHQLHQIEQGVRSTCRDIIDEMQQTVRDDVATLEDADVPADFYERPIVVENDYLQQLDDADSFPSFRQSWLNAVGELATAIDAISDKAAVADVYVDIADIIDEKLVERGRVGPDDLPVRQPEKFMDLYAQTVDGVTYDTARGELVGEHFGDTFDCTVFARFETGGDQRELTAHVRGPEVDETKTATTHLAEEFVFDDLPYGEYEVEVTAPASTVEPISEALRLSQDRRLELTLRETTVVEQVCADVPVEAKESVDDVASALKSEISASEYLSDAMDLPIAEKYAPCLLALWAEEAGYDVRIDEDSVLVYDAEQFQRRLENVITHNLEEGKEMAFSTVRDQFLAVPASDRLIRETIRDSSVADQVELDETEMIQV